MEKAEEKYNETLLKAIVGVHKTSSRKKRGRVASGLKTEPLLFLVSFKNHCKSTVSRNTTYYYSLVFKESVDCILFKRGIFPAYSGKI